MEIAKMVLEYIKVILSIHLVIGAVVMMFISLFREEVGELINRVLSIKFPGGELSMSQSEKTYSDQSGKKDPPAVPESSKTPLPANLSLAPDQVKTIQELIQSQRAEAYLWEYRFLNYYLVHNTQRVLDWLVSLSQRPSIGLYDSMWIPAIPSAEERHAIISALQQHHLIVLKDNLIDVTDKGREYAQWRGTLPSIAS